MARWQGSILLVLALAVVACHAGDDPTVSMKGVHDLTPDNFDSLVNGGKHALVEFYAPWCGHCKRMVGEYTALGEAIEADPKLKSRVVIAKVNADEHRDIGSRFGVRGFPTIKFFPRGKTPTQDTAEAYSGARTKDNFLSFIKDKISADKTFARVSKLDKLAAEAGKATQSSDLKAAVEALEAAAGKLKGEAKENGELYVKLAKKALAKGSEYFKTEKARLERMISSGGIAAAKLEEMNKKSGILEAFVGEEEEDAGAKKDEE